MLSPFLAIVRRDVLLMTCKRGEWGMPLFFFVMTVSLFPIALGPQSTLLPPLAPAIIWVAVVLSLLMSLEGVFRSDHQEGILEQFVLSPYPLPLLLLGKSTAHWLAMGLPLLILAPVLGFMLHLSASGVGALLLTLIIGIPTLSLMGCIGATLTIGLHQGGLLLAILILPLMMPVIIFGTSGVVAANQALPFYAEILLLSALLLLMLVLGPIVAAMALRASLE
jgi:heme exporter protein B